MKTSFLLALGLFLSASPCPADSILEYRVNANQPDNKASQAVWVKSGQVMIKNAGGDKNLDILYSRAQEKLVIIDHRKRSFMALDESKIKRLSQQADTLQPLIQGLSEQMAGLSPKQRAKWEQMLGGNLSLDKLAQAARPVAPAQMVATGENISIAGFSCKDMEVTQASAKVASVCLASQEALKLPEQDYATLRALFGFTERLSARAQGLAGQFGVSLPPFALGKIAGIPIAMQDLSKENRGQMVLSSLRADAEIAAAAMQIPPDYQAERLTPW
jgi:hypothetical protein